MRSNRKLFRIYFMLVFIPLAFSALAPGQEEKRNALSKIRIKNFGMVNETFYRGAQPERVDYEGLAAGGIRSVLNLRSDDQPVEQKVVEASGMKYFSIKMSDSSWPTTEQVEGFLKIVIDPANLPIFVHCKGGRHRAGVMTAIYRIEHDGWTADQAYTEMSQYGFNSGIGHHGLKHFLYFYYAQRKDATTPK